MTDDTPKPKKTPPLTREERLAQNLRNNLRRRKQAMRKTKIADRAEADKKEAK